MHTNRRNWLKTAGLLTAGVCFTRLKTIASPLPDPFTDNPDDKGPVRLSSNENPYGPSPLARVAMGASINLGNRYQWSMINELMSALAANHNVAKENILTGAGSTQIIDTVIQLAALQKGNFIIAEPGFNRWKSAAESLGLQRIAIPLTTDKRHDLPAMLQAIRPDTKLIYLCNPNNPTGTICQYDALVSFVKDATKKTLVLLDEAYIDYTDEISLSNLVTDNENLIIVKTFSKIYGLAGARIGYAIAHTKTTERLTQLQSGSNMGISAVSLVGALASLKDRDFVKISYSLNEQARKFTIEQLERLNIPCIPSYSNFIYFSLAKYKRDFFAQLKTNNIEGTGIFEEPGKWSRITVGTMQEMQQFISAIG